ncbi:MAG: hypothetical protein H6933_17440 [Burkholderiaceae bacterium]|nr:hypothetical protein [Rhodoferax sp.]MCP5286675.1 hypothetical protein [Burkholderiaceae bacterium]
MKTVLLTLTAALLLGAGAAHAQFSVVPAPLTQGAPVPSEADSPQAYKKDFAQHVYKAYPMRIYRGQLPPLLYSVMLTETKLDAQGNVVDVTVIRKPAVDAVAPFIVQLIKRAAPFPAPAKMGEASVMEIWLVDKSGAFQVDTLTEGQK